jgi:hypothetical protein
MSGKEIILAAFTMIFAACAPVPDDDASTSSASTEALIGPGYYQIAAAPQSAQWINAVNLHADGTFEGSFGDGVSNNSGFLSSADGTYAIDSSASEIRFTYGASTEDAATYRIRAAGNDVQLELVDTTDPSEESWFTLTRGAKPAALVFGEHWTTKQEGALVAGAPLFIEYAAARSSCAPSASQRSAVVTAIYIVDGEFSQQQILQLPVYAQSGNYRGLMGVPNGHELSMWFELNTSDASGNSTCSGWDSNENQNYNFAIGD